MLALVREHDRRKQLYSVRKQAQNYRKDLDVPDVDSAENKSVTAYAKRTKLNAKRQAEAKIAPKLEKNLCMGSTLLVESKRQMSTAIQPTNG